MKPKTMVMLLVAIGCGVLAAIGSTFLGPRANQEDKVNILVAKADIPTMTKVGKTPGDQFAWKQVDKKSAVPNAITDMKKLENKVVIRKLAKDMPVTEMDLSDRIGFDLKEDERAVAINVNLEKTGGGFVVPGSRVDVISVKKAGARSVVQTPFSNVEVLAVNTLTEQPQKVQTIAPATVTLKVTASEAQKLAFFNQTTTLFLALRSNNSNDAKGLEPYLEPEEDEEVEYLVARTDIDANTVLEDPTLLFEKKKELRSKVPQGALHDFEIVKGKTIKNVILAKNPITPKDFVVKKAEPEAKPVIVKTPPKRHFEQVIRNGATEILKLHPEKPTKDELRAAPPASPLNNDGSDGKN
jgi:Flp pilus assembly protein CpaB